MYSEIITKITAVLATVTSIKEVHFDPELAPTKFPCAYVTPTGLENRYESLKDNQKVIRFAIDIVMAKGSGSMNTLYTSTAPMVADALIAAFDTDWDMSTISGHRVRCALSSGEQWQVVEMQKGQALLIPFILEVKLLTNN